jgi:hypothetical protein
MKYPDDALDALVSRSGDHEWTVLGETYADHSSARLAARSAMATERAEMLEALVESIDDQPGVTTTVLEGRIRSRGGLVIEAESLRFDAVSWALRAAL